MYAFDFFRFPDDEPLPGEARSRHLPPRPPDFERIACLAQLAAPAAVRAWLLFDFGFDEEPALCFALRTDPGIDLPNEAIYEVMDDVLDAELADDEVFAFDDPDLDDIVPETLALLRAASAYVASDRARRGRRR